MGRDADASRLKNNVTAQKQLLKKRENLRNPMFWLHMVAFAQIFNIIVEASLEAQHETYLSTSALHMVTKAMEKIKALGENWVWEEEALTFSGIGSPSKHLENLKNVFFQPVVGVKAKKRRARMINSINEYRGELLGVSEEVLEEERISYTDIRVGDIQIVGF